MRIIFVLCEGNHDVAFLSRLLSADGYKKYMEKLYEFPYPLNGWFTKISKNLRIDGLNLERMTDDIKAILPSRAMINQERSHLILLYSMNGDIQKDKRNKVISELRSWTLPPENDKEFSLIEESAEEGSSYGLLVFFDADEHGVAARIDKAKEELSEYFVNAGTISRNGQIEVMDNNMKIGIYIFADPETGKGTLENILLPVMRKNNESIFKEADDFLNRHYDETRLKQLIFKIHPQNGLIEKRDKKNKYHHIKSLMGVVGQLQNSGSSNTVCIEKADYITLDKIRGSQICQEILEMFSKL